MKNLYILFCISISFLFLTACDGFFDYTPSNAVNNENAYESAKDIENALNGAYFMFGTSRFYGRNVIALSEIATDNMWTSGSNDHFKDIYRYTISPENNDLYGIWYYGYKVIDHTTRLIQGGKTLLNTNISDNDKKTIQNAISQAYALKAFSHFTLVNIFALPFNESNKSQPGIIIVDSKPIEIFQPVHRSTINEVYIQILKDIGNAKEYIQTSTTDVFHFGPSSILAFEARVKLYMQDWEGASNAAKEILRTTSGKLETNPADYINMWYEIAPTTEDLFTISKSIDDNLGVESLNHLFSSYGGKATSGLISLFDKNDIRLNLFEKGVEDQRRPLKFDGISSSKQTNNIPVFRLPEVYLILAEAKAHLNQPDAVDYLFEIAKRNPGLKREDIPTDKTELLQFIAKERRRELFEEGHRYFDMRRTGERLNRMGGIFPITDWPISEFVYPIPSREINASDIEQNEGWHTKLP